jgi:hypothetical protein
MAVGTLYYGDSRHPISIDDRSLAHVKIVIINKLRRNESFSFSWAHADRNGRSTIWLSPAIALHFEFEGGRAPALNRHWLEQLAQVASSTAGLVLSDEPSEGAADN